MGYFVEQYDNDNLLLAATADKREVDAVAEHCKAMRSVGAGNGKDDKLAMSAPGWVVNDWCVRKGIRFAEFMRDRKLQTRFLNDPDNAHFRVWTGRV